MKTRWAFIAILLVALQVAPTAYSLQLASVETASEAAKSEAAEPVATDTPDGTLYEDGTRAIHEGRWSDAEAIFNKVASVGGERADAALYWKAYAENKQGQSSRALDTCNQLRRDFPKSPWIEECGALEIEIRAGSAKPVEPQSEQDKELKLLALNSLMKQDEPRALSELQPILKGDSPEEIKERALFIVAQGQSKQAQELLRQIAQESSNSALQAKATQLLGDPRDKQTDAPPADTQATSAQVGVPVSMVVTAQGHHGSELPNISAESVIVNEGRSRAKVTALVPLQGDRAGLELFVLLDDSMASSRGTQLEDVQHFIMAQPSTTKIGVAYMQEGGTKIAQSLTSDHSLASASLHVTLGKLAGAASPYVALDDLIKKWPAGNERREIIMISNGVDLLFGQETGRDNIYVDSAVAEAQRAGIIVFTINSSQVERGLNANRTSSDEIGPGTVPSGGPGAGRTGWGRNDLDEVAGQTGGVSYYLESGAPVSFAPYLEDATRRLNRQYELTFLAKPGKKPGLQAVKVKVETPHAEVTVAERVYVPAR